jgi:pimeloyl-ACP methyl ester carboxylesterase
MSEPTVDGARRRTLTTNGIELSYLDAGTGPVVVLCHGFPELAYSWRHQVPALVAAGFRVLAPDQRGYGRTTRPEAVEDYDIEHLTGDITSLLDAAGADRAVVVGHDWGAIVAWSLAQLQPSRVAGVAGMSVPFIPRPPAPPIQIMRQLFAGSFFYMVYFQEPGVADADLGADPAMTMRRMLAGLSITSESDVTAALAGDDRGFVERLPEPEALPAWLSQEELDTYVGEFTRTGFTGGINWYRNLDRNWHLTPQLAGAKLEVPSLFVGGTADPVLVMSPPAAAEEYLLDHRGTVLVEGAGHWVQQEAPGPVNDALVAFAGALRDEGRLTPATDVGGER